MAKNRKTLAGWALGALLACPAIPAGQPPAVPAPKTVNANNPLGLQMHHITATVSDVDRAVQWYRDMLGFKLDLRGSRADGRFQFAEMALPSLRLSFVTMRDDNRDARRGGDGHGGARGDNDGRRRQEPRWERITLAVTDPAALYAEMQKRGAKPHTRGAGPVNSFLMNDPDGNEIEIVRIGAETR